ncbi:MAG: ABC transporter ATP-binding protein [Erysipelotrichaceae bacterium]|nr:ABC transporter ATP-binding protein [Erysipelotrichaceae bacterium]
MLDIKNLSKTFNPGTATENKVLDNVSLHINPGDFVTVIGGNGAGKSTILNMIAGVFPPDSGTIVLDGQDITNLKEHKRAHLIGRVFQDPLMGTCANMEIVENLALANRRGQKRTLKWGVTKEETEVFREKLKELDLGLETRLSDKAGLLSGGQRQALTLLMASLQKPKILLLDEHTAALDPKTAARVLALTVSIISDNNLTALMITHNMKDALKYGNRLIMMNDGKIVLDIDNEQKQKLTVNDLLQLFEQATGEELSNDRVLLSK